MSSPPVHVFFFRGLSTYGHDNARFSWLDFGPTYQHVARAFTAKGILFHPVLGMGSGTLVEVAARATAYVHAHPIFRDQSLKVHFLGHSAGGLISRLVLGQGGVPAGKVVSCMTVATPHLGSQLARLFLEMPQRHCNTARLLRTFGYDLRGKTRFFNALTKEAVAQVLASSEHKNVDRRNASVVCSMPRSQWCIPLKLIHQLKALDDFVSPSDGVVERDSQPFGEVVAEMDIDHFCQIGLFGDAKRFNGLCTLLIDFFLRTQRLHN